MTTQRLSEINAKIQALRSARIPTDKWDYGKMREKREIALQDARTKLTRHKALNGVRDTLYPELKGNPYSLELTPDICYANNYIRLIEEVIKCKNELEVMDLSLDGLLFEKINILEELIL
jgi:hypothetical protein